MKSAARLNKEPPSLRRRFLKQALFFALALYGVLLGLGGLIFLVSHIPPKAVNLDAVKSWGIEVEGNQIKVDGHMRTSLPGVFACGDIVTYDGKYKLLLTASSEGCVAANSAYVHVRKPQRVTMGELYT